jgi:hypothetical protein
VKENNTAFGEAEYWRARSATFNTLFQQLTMPNVKKILKVSGNKLKISLLI